MRPSSTVRRYAQAAYDHLRLHFDRNVPLEEIARSIRTMFSTGVTRFCTDAPVPLARRRLLFNNMNLLRVLTLASHCAPVIHRREARVRIQHVMRVDANARVRILGRVDFQARESVRG